MSIGKRTRVTRTTNILANIYLFDVYDNFKKSHSQKTKRIVSRKKYAGHSAFVNVIVCPFFFYSGGKYFALEKKTNILRTLLYRTHIVIRNTDCQKSKLMYINTIDYF